VAVTCVAVMGLLLAPAPVVSAAPIPSSSPSWYWQSPTWGGDSITDVSFVNEHLGWGVGSFRGVRYTTDGGLTWNVTQVGPPLGAMGVYFVDEQHGWMVGQGSDSYGYDDSWHFVYVTSDGGASWHQQLIEFDPENRAGLSSVWVDDDLQHGWRAGRASHIYHTADGGEEWTRVDNLPIPEWAQPAYGITTMQWLSHEVGFLLGTDLGGNEFLLISTVDGGESWTVNLLPYEIDDHLVEPLWNLFFLDEEHGYVSGWGNWVLYTEDGGQTWVNRSVPATPDQFDIRGMHFDDVEHGWAACSGGFIAHTTDGGRNWNVFDSENPSTLRTMTRLDDNTLLSMGDIGYGLRSTDNDSTWMPVAEGIWLGFPLAPGDGLGSDSCFTSEDSGWICGPRGQLCHSTDEGRTWTRVPVGDYADADFTRVQFVDRLTGWVADTRGVIHRTVDGGNSWQHVDTGTGQVICDLFFFDAMRGWASGYNATLLYTEDGGQSWQARDPDVDGDLMTLFFVDENHGWAAGSIYVGPEDEDDLRQAQGVAFKLAARRGSYFPRRPDENLLLGEQEEEGTHPRLTRTTDGGVTRTECTFGNLD